MTKYAEAVLLFDTDSTTGILKELGDAIDANEIAGKEGRIKLILVCKKLWQAIETELAPLVNAGYDVVKVRPYEKASSKPNAPFPVKSGYNALIYRNRAIVPIAGENIVADRVGAND